MQNILNSEKSNERSKKSSRELRVKRIQEAKKKWLTLKINGVTNADRLKRVKENKQKRKALDKVSIPQTWWS